MKKVFLFFAMALLSVFAVAQTTHYNQVVWLNGKVMYAAPVPAIDSITYTDEATEQDTLHLLLPRTIVRVQYDTITVVKHDTVYIYKSHAAIGKFFVSTDRQVSFAPGNLRYQASTNTWRFADEQYDYVGTTNSNISATYDSWIDLFGWGTANNPTLSSKNYADYPTFADWGTNSIGLDSPATWRTLTSDEWTYLFQHTRWTMATINNTLGFLLLPDNFTVPVDLTMSILADGNLSTGGLSFSESDYASNQYTVAEFAQLEAMGCVFLPCSGFRNSSQVSLTGEKGFYWSSTPNNVAKAKYFYISSTEASVGDSGDSRNFGQAVRLVQDIQ